MTMQYPVRFPRVPRIAVAMAAAALIALPGVLSAAKPEAAPQSEDEKVSYSIGVSVGRNMQRQGIELRAEAFAQGVKDALGGGKLAMSDEDMQKVLAAFQTRMQAKQQSQQHGQMEQNMMEGKAFLAANAQKKGVVTTASGLQYKVLVAGKGRSPSPTERVVAHYKGTLIDGTEFDSSYARKQPAEFPVNGVIQGWQEVLPLMKIGAKWMVYIPSELAYGERGAGAKIGPNATLIFEIELLEVK